MLLFKIRRLSAFLETEVTLNNSGRSNAGRLFVKLDFSDVRDNATVALQNILALVGNDLELPLESERLQNFSEKIDRMLEPGKAAMRSSLARPVANAIPQADAFVEAIDKVVQVRQLIIRWHFSEASQGPSIPRRWLATRHCAI